MPTRSRQSSAAPSNTSASSRRSTAAAAPSASGLPLPDYLEDGFNASSQTVPRLRSLLLELDNAYPPSTAKKPELVTLLENYLAQNRARLIRNHKKVKPSSKGIVVVDSSAEPSEASESDDSDEDEEIEEVKPTRGKAKGKGKATTSAAATPAKARGTKRPAPTPSPGIEDIKVDPYASARPRASNAAPTPKKARRAAVNDASDEQDGEEDEDVEMSGPTPKTEKKKPRLSYVELALRGATEADPNDTSGFSDENPFQRDSPDRRGSTSSSKKKGRKSSIAPSELKVDPDAEQPRSASPLRQSFTLPHSEQGSSRGRLSTNSAPTSVKRPVAAAAAPVPQSAPRRSYVLPKVEPEPEPEPEEDDDDEDMLVYSEEERVDPVVGGNEYDEDEDMEAEEEPEWMQDAYAEPALPPPPQPQSQPRYRQSRASAPITPASASAGSSSSSAKKARFSTQPTMPPGPGYSPNQSDTERLPSAPLAQHAIGTPSGLQPFGRRRSAAATSTPPTTSVARPRQSTQLQISDSPNSVVARKPIPFRSKSTSSTALVRRKSANAVSAVSKPVPATILSFIGTLLIAYLTWASAEKSALGYCDTGRSINVLTRQRDHRAVLGAAHVRVAGFTIPTLESVVKGETKVAGVLPRSLVPTCRICPPHASCDKGGVSCAENYVRQEGMGGTVSCVPDTERLVRVAECASWIEKRLRVVRGEKVCAGLGLHLTHGERDRDVKMFGEKKLEVEKSWGAYVKKNAKMRNALEKYPDLFELAVADLLEHGDVVESQPGLSELYLAAKSADMTLTCRAKVATVDYAAGKKWQLSGIVALLLSVLYGKLMRSQTQQSEAQAKGLVRDVFEALQNQERQHYIAPDVTPQSYVSVVHLRDDLLASITSPVARREAWRRVERIVEHNSNVRTNMAEVRGELTKTWQWVGSVAKTKRELEYDGEGSGTPANRGYRLPATARDMGFPSRAKEEMVEDRRGSGRF